MMQEMETLGQGERKQRASAKSLLAVTVEELTFHFPLAGRLTPGLETARWLGTVC